MNDYIVHVYLWSQRSSGSFCHVLNSAAHFFNTVSSHYVKHPFSVSLSLSLWTLSLCSQRHSSGASMECGDWLVSFLSSCLDCGAIPGESGTFKDKAGRPSVAAERLCGPSFCQSGCWLFVECSWKWTILRSCEESGLFVLLSRACFVKLLQTVLSWWISVVCPCLLSIALFHFFFVQVLQFFRLVLF